MRRTEIAGFRAESYEILQGMARKTACSACEIKDFAVVQGELLGDMDERTWARWKTGDVGRIDRELQARMAILMAIHKSLRYLFTEPARGYTWIRKPNAAFGGRSALNVMMRGEVSDLIEIRTYLVTELALN